MSISRVPLTGTDTPQIQAAIDRLVSEVNRSIGSRHDAQGKRLTNLSQPVASGDAVPLSYMKNYVDTVVNSIVSKKLSNLDLTGGAADDPTVDLAEVRVTDTAPTREWQADGSLRLYGAREDIIGYYPGYIGIVFFRNIGQFQGVNVYWENAEEPLRPLLLGASEYTGSAAADSPDNIGEIDVVIPRGKLKVGDNYLHLRAYGETRRFKYYPHALAPSDTYWKITITQADLDDHPTTVTGTLNDPTTVTTIVQDYGQEKVLYGASWVPPNPIGATNGYEIEFRFYNTASAGDDEDYYRTFAGYIDGGYASLFYVRDAHPRETKTVYVRAFVRAYDGDRSYGPWVAGSTVAVLPIGTSPGEYPGVAAITLTIQPVPEGPAHFYVHAELTPPSPLGGATHWELEMGYYTLETGGTLTYGWIPLTNRIEITTTTHLAGPFIRAIDNPLEPPWGALRTRLILADGSKTEYVYSTRKVIEAAAAPTPTITNNTTIEYDTISGKPSYRFNKSVTFNGSKTGVEWTRITAFFYTNSEGTILDGEVPLGGVDPSLNDAWPITVTEKTDWWDLPDYDVWWKVGVAVYNAANTEGTWYYTTLAKMNKSAGYDASHANTTTIHGLEISGGTLKPKISTGTDARLVLDSSGYLTPYALTELARWGLGTADFGTSSGNVVINNAVINRLLSQTVTITDTLTIIRGTTGGQIEIDGDGISLSKAGSLISLDITSTGVTINLGASYTVSMTSSGASFRDLTCGPLNILADNGTVFNNIIYDAGSVMPEIVINIQTGTFANFNHTSGSVTLSTAATWRTALGLGNCAVLGTGTASNQVALGNHIHSGYATSTHTHTSADVSGDARFATWGTDTFDMSIITSVGWVPCYNSGGTYMGKIPII